MIKSVSDPLEQKWLALVSSHSAHVLCTKADANIIDEMEGRITVKINGVEYKVPKSHSGVTLNSYLREQLHLTGTKVTCREGGCGACIVTVALPDPLSPVKEIKQRSINSCLCPILSCDGWEITTIEGIGTHKNPHALQTALTAAYGTQCGYCTPGMIMTMYSLLQDRGGATSLTKDTIEDSFGGNICRCTGYRPILAAFRTFATGEPNETVPDLEDLRKCSSKATSDCKSCAHLSRPVVTPLPLSVQQSAPPWYKPTTLPELYTLIQKLDGRNVYLVVGHTAVGVYDDGPYGAYVDMKGVRELYVLEQTDGHLTMGANIPLTEVISILLMQTKKPGFAYMRHIANLLKKTAHLAVRNFGSWAGNLMMKNRHKEFPSDTYTAFTTVKAKLTICSVTDTGMTLKEISMEEFHDINMTKNIILTVTLSAFDDLTYKFEFSKPMPRTQNAHGYVNAGFRVSVQLGSGKVVVSDCGLVFGNISASFVHATQTESFLDGKQLTDPGVLQQTLAKLYNEVQPVDMPAESSIGYRRSLCITLFYKYALKLAGDRVCDRYKSGIGSLQRPLSSATQTYKTKPDLYPLTQPVPKVEGLVQCTGEAHYISDIDDCTLLHAAFAYTTVANAVIYAIDVAPAMAPGVIRVITAKDIPGKNDISVAPAAYHEECLLPVGGTVSYAGQAVALVVAEKKEVAEATALLVRIQYTNVQPPILTCQDAIKKGSFFPYPNTYSSGNVEDAISKSPNKIAGDYEIGTQAHFHMETQVCVAYPTEDGIDLDAGTQYIQWVQDTVSSVLGIGKNRINVRCRRNGGGFGAKGGRDIVISTALSVAAVVLKRPIKMHISLHDNLRMNGKRIPYYVQYRVGTDATGKLNGIALVVYSNSGSLLLGDYQLYYGYTTWGDNTYKCPNWSIKLNPCKTNRPPQFFCRAPGSTEAVHCIETILEHVARSVGKTAIEVKQLNFYTDGDTTIGGALLKNYRMGSLVNSLLISSQFSDRLKAVNDFNTKNRWRKKGGYHCLIAVFRNGGTIAITHGGIEMGQGIHTKVTQAVAYELGVPMDLIVIQPTCSITSANNRVTAAGVSCELACLSAIAAARLLKNYMSAIKETHATATWAELVELCFTAGVNLTAHAWSQAQSSNIQYSVFAAMCTEVLLDVLTGEHQITRLDVLYDCGESISPLCDIGQVEGALVMGLGYYTTEETIFDKTTGQNLTFSTWKYKPLGAKDIPIDLRVTLLPDAPNPSGVLRSKTTGEAPLVMSTSVVFALRNAINAQRAEVTPRFKDWIRLDPPLTAEKLQQYCNVDLSQLRYCD